MMDDLNFQMLKIRRVEEAIADRYPELKIRCPTHLSIGQEAVAVGVCANLRPTDKVFSGHRAHAHYLAKGGDLPRLIAELYGKATGCCGGIGGSMHLQDPDAGFIASTSIVGGIIPIAVGSAWADKLKGNNNITVVFLGDGACEEGVFHESLNFASLHKLLVLFVVENNGLAVTTPLQDRQGNRGLHLIAAAHGLGWENVNGQDIEAVYNITNHLVTHVRQGQPMFLQVFTERQRVHCGIEHEYELKNDPVKHGTPEEELEIQLEIEAAFRFAEESPVPNNPERGVYA